MIKVKIEFKGHTIDLDSADFDDVLPSFGHQRAAMLATIETQLKFLAAELGMTDEDCVANPSKKKFE